MKNSKVVLFCLTFFSVGAGIHLMNAGASGKAATGGDRVVLQIEVFRLNGEVLGSLDLVAEDAASQTGDLPVRRFRAAKLKVGSNELQADSGGWTWNGSPEAPDDRWVSRIAAPRVTLPVDQSFKITAAPEQGVEYFTRRPDGLFELNRASARTGIAIGSRVTHTDPDVIHFDDARISLTVVDSRQEILGVTMDVGLPNLISMEYETGLDLRPGENQGLMVSTGGHGFVLIRIRADYH